MPDIDAITALITAVLTFLSTAGGLWVAARRRGAAEKKLLQANASGIKETVDVKELLLEARAATRADRVQIMTMHNCGGPPKPGSPYYSSVYEDSSSRQLPSMKSEWQEVILDDKAIRMASEMHEHGYATYAKSDMVGGPVGDAMDTQEVYRTVHVLVGVTPEHVAYTLTFDFVDVVGDPLDDPRFRSNARFVVRLLRDYLDDKIIYDPTKGI